MADRNLQVETGQRRDERRRSIAMDKHDIGAFPCYAGAGCRGIKPWRYPTVFPPRGPSAKIPAALPALRASIPNAERWLHIALPKVAGGLTQNCAVVNCTMGNGLVKAVFVDFSKRIGKFKS